MIAARSNLSNQDVSHGDLGGSTTRQQVAVTELVVDYIKNRDIKGGTLITGKLSVMLYLLDQEPTCPY